MKAQSDLRYREVPRPSCCTQSSIDPLYSWCTLTRTAAGWTGCRSPGDMTVGRPCPRDSSVPQDTRPLFLRGRVQSCSSRDGRSSLQNGYNVECQKRCTFTYYKQGAKNEDVKDLDVYVCRTCVTVASRYSHTILVTVLSPQARHAVCHTGAMGLVVEGGHGTWVLVGIGGIVLTVVTCNRV